MRPIKKTPPAYLQQLTAAGGEQERVAIYHALIESLGNYCSYCEMPLSGYHIEHIRFLAAWPEHVSFSQWDDLLLICNDCRNHIRVPELNALSASTMLWPDKDLTFSLYNSPLKYELRKVDYIVVDEEEDNLEISREQKELVFVVPGGDPGDLRYQKAFNTIVHFQLNMQLEYYNEATGELRIPKYVDMQRSDNRMFKRTAAWFDALDSINSLKQLEALELTNLPVLRDALIRQIAMTAWYSGNWSVWMTVFFQETGDLELIRTALAGDVHVFPATNNDNDALFSAQ